MRLTHLERLEAESIYIMRDAVAQSGPYPLSIGSVKLADGRAVKGFLVEAEAVAGAEDILTPPRFSTLLAERIPDNRLLVVDGAGHGLIWSHPAIVVDHIADFLSTT